MNVHPLSSIAAHPLSSIAAQLSRLSVTVARRGPVRFGSSQKQRDKEKEKAKAAAATAEAKAATPARPGPPPRKIKTQPPPRKLMPGHGEKIWIHTDTSTGLTVYSHEPRPKASRMYRQIPFHGKKLRPAKIRKDYWRTLAMIQFPPGYGASGLSAYHVLRELRMRHELEWNPADYQHVIEPWTGKKRPMSVRQRGAALNNQKPHAIADMAVALAGAGKGSKMWLRWTKDRDAAVMRARGVKGLTTIAQTTGQPASGLVKATVFWTKPDDLKYAKEWSPNVTHALFEGSQTKPIEGRVEKNPKLIRASDRVEVVPSALIGGRRQHQLQRPQPREPQPREPQLAPRELVQGGQDQGPATKSSSL